MPNRSLSESGEDKDTWRKKCGQAAHFLWKKVVSRGVGPTRNNMTRMVMNT